MSADQTMRLLYCSDLHGDRDHYTRLEAAARQMRPDVIILGGDMLPDDSALQPDQMGHTQPQFVREVLRSILENLRKAAGGATILFVFGNHDWGSSVVAVQELADDGLVRILDPKIAIEIDGVRFVGYSYTPPTPWYVKDFERLDEPGDRPPLLGGARWDPRFSRVATHPSAVLFKNGDSIAEDLADIAVPADPWVFVAHAPPHGSDLDRTFGDKSYGSRAIRAVIEQRQPTLSLHGHIHESPRVSGSIRQDFGRTVSVNVGQTSDELSYAAIEIDVAAAKITNLEHRHQS